MKIVKKRIKKKVKVKNNVKDMSIEVITACNL